MARVFAASADPTRGGAPDGLSARRRIGGDGAWQRGKHGISALSTVLENKPAARGRSVADKLALFNGLQSFTNTIHATTHLDEIILDLGRDICSLFGSTDIHQVRLVCIK